MSTTSKGEGGRGRFPLWLILLWAAFVVWMASYMIRGLVSTPH
jgi:hypothetical protein